VWRVVDVPSSFTFSQFHLAIQASMGWENRHLHHFEIKNPKTQTIDYIGYTEYDFDDEYTENMFSDEDIKLSDYFSRDNATARYIYDYSSGWIHIVTLKEILVPEQGIRYPRCVDGQRACPPEDCGGPAGYRKLCEIISNPSHEQYQTIIQWVGEGFDPDRFRPERVQFKIKDDQN